MPPWRLSRHFLGRPASVTEARRFITATLAAWPVVESAELIVSELATNAVRHTASARFGGKFIVSIQAEPDQVWLGVTDEGGPGAPGSSGLPRTRVGAGCCWSPPWPTTGACTAARPVVPSGRCSRSTPSPPPRRRPPGDEVREPARPRPPATRLHEAAMV